MFGPNIPFDGTYFKALYDGIYSFYVNVNHASTSWGHIYIYQGDLIVAHAKRACGGYHAPLVLQTTLKLEKGNKVHVRLDGELVEAGFQIGNSENLPHEIS